MKPFVSTRNAKAPKVDFATALLSPSAPNGGLYTLESIPKIDFKPLLDSSYEALCEEIFKILDIELAPSLLQSALSHYKSFDNPHNPAPITKLDNAYFLELYHGPTRAFKDMALCPFGEIFAQLAKQRNERYLILTATSGDTGPATLESFANKDNIKVVCLYPKGGTSDVQALQMTTNTAKNIKVLGIQGNFDDAQSALKSLLRDEGFCSFLHTKHYALSAANSVNFGRIAFQIIYHIWGYIQLIKEGQMHYGDEIEVIIPSGNFGNALGAFFAKNMGLPISKIIIASNKNNILSEFIHTGIYDISTKSLQKTLSPAMDILKSSNVERILFALFGDKRTAELLAELEQSGKYALKANELTTLQEYFDAWWGDDEQTKHIIKLAYDKGYILDPHTAIGYGAYLARNANTKTAQKALICSTAEWSKFAPSVVESIFGKKCKDAEAIALMLQNGAKIGSSIQGLFDKKIVHTQVIPKDGIKQEILQWL